MSGELNHPDPECECSGAEFPIHFRRPYIMLQIAFGVQAGDYVRTKAFN